jgi:hypothetical protein
LGEFVTHVAQIRDDFDAHRCALCKKLCPTKKECDPSKSSRPSKLWYRGEEKDHGSLLPSLYRPNLYEIPQGNAKYSAINLHEDSRMQVFRARIYHQWPDRPDENAEWFEIQQHHYTHTRMLDFSEDAVSALSFALLPLFDPRDGDRDISWRRSDIQPVMWILNPRYLNAQVYLDLISWELISRAFPTPHSLMKTIANRLEKEQSCLLSEGLCHDQNLAYICLGVLEAQRAERGGILAEEALLKRQELNPFHSLLLRYFVDGLPVQDKLLHPLATLHQYHNKRIEVQRGCFVAFPNYHTDATERMPGYMLNNQPEAENLLAKVHLTDPVRILHELKLLGRTITQTYPETTWWSHELEHKSGGPRPPP